LQIDSSATAPPDWDAYVRAHSAATAYHFADAVSVGKRAFRLRTTYLVARNSVGNPIGVLPLVEQSSLLFGRFISSVPFFTYGGVLADDDSAAVTLVERAAEFAQARGARHLELRHTSSIDGLTFPERTDKVSMVLELPDDEERLAKQLGSKLRSQIRRADREQPEIVWGGAELLPDFYSTFAAAMHDLGTPVYPRSFFKIVCESLNGAVVLVCRVAGRAQAAAILVRHGDRIEVPWAAATREAKRGAINMRMYWEMLRYSIRSGAKQFDFGRSSVDSGTYRFKAQWGARPQQLRWHYWLPRSAEIPKLNPSNPRYALAVNVWRRIPLWCANLLGPHIVRNLP
jgi:FemAB-related protein (PEP-CTERM system-associated)